MHRLPGKGMLCALCCAGVILFSCCSPSATPPRGAPTPEPTKKDATTMVTMLFPELYLSTNGAAALLDKTFGHVELYGLPDLALRWANESVQGLDGVALSSSGRVALLRTFGDTLILVDDEGTRSYTLPGNRGQIMDVAISDGGDRLAMLTLVAPQGTGEQAQENGRLEIWSLPPGGAPVASAQVVLFDYGFVTGNGSLTALSVYSARTSGTDRAMEIFVSDAGGGTLRRLSKEQPFAGQWIHAALHGAWVWIVQEHALVGWQPGQAPVQLPGTVGDQLAFSPGGDHLLAYRVDRVVDATSAEMLFRLFDLDTLEEVKRVTHAVAGDSEARFALSPELSLLLLRMGEESQLTVEELGW